MSSGLQVVSKNKKLPVASKAMVALNDVLSLKVEDASTVLAHVKNTGTVSMATSTFAFEGSVDSTNGVDGTWFPLLAVRADSPGSSSAGITVIIAPLAASAGWMYGYRISVNGVKWFRIKTNQAPTASSIAFWTVTQSAQDVEISPLYGAQVNIVGNASVVPASGSITTANVVGTASTNAAVDNGNPRSLLEVSVFNPTAATIYVKFYNKNSTPAPATDVPVMVIAVPTNSEKLVNLGVMGKRFSTGVAHAIVGGPTNTDATAVAAGVLLSLTLIS